MGGSVVDNLEPGRPPSPADRARDERLDLMRGYFLAIITINHLSLAGNDWMRAVTGLNQLWVSAAAGFVLVSGAVVGTIYPDRLARHGLGPCLRRALRRSVQLYLIAAVGQLLLASIDFFLRHRYGLLTTAPASYLKLVQGALLQDGYRFYYFQLLPLYAVLLPAGVCTVFLVKRGYVGWVLLGSFILWGLRLSDPRALRVFANGFQPASWQIIYLAGILAGYYRDAIARWWQAHPVLRRGGSALLLAAAGTISFLSYQVAFHGWFTEAGWLQRNSAFFNKSTVGVGRAAAALMVMTRSTWWPRSAGVPCAPPWAGCCCRWVSTP